MFWFQLWREFKLSLAEIFSVFPEIEIVNISVDFLIAKNISKQDILQKAKRLGWTIKIVEILDEDHDIHNLIQNNIVNSGFEGKYTYALNMYWVKNKSLANLLKFSKQIIKENHLNPRFINKNNKNINSVLIIKEALIKKETDFNIIWVKDINYFWRTIWVQNIYWYSNRDYWKERNMFIWMLPPKLAQMMINLANTQNKDTFTVYDPFVGLWTVLIESVNMWNKKVFWSDLNPEMVRISRENVKNIDQKIDVDTRLQNSKYIREIDFLKEVDFIVTEWYLWEIMTQKNINTQRINKQIDKLADLYEWFFAWLKENNFKWNIVISFPFWELNKKYCFFDKIYDIIKKYCEVNILLPEWISYSTTKFWSLLYKRKSQLVWREIFNLRIK